MSEEATTVTTSELSETELRTEIPELGRAALAILGAKPKYKEAGFGKFLSGEADSFDAQIVSPVRDIAERQISGVGVDRTPAMVSIRFSHRALDSAGVTNKWCVILCLPTDETTAPSVSTVNLVDGKTSGNKNDHGSLAVAKEFVNRL